MSARPTCSTITDLWCAYAETEPGTVDFDALIRRLESLRSGVNSRRSRADLDTLIASLRDPERVGTLREAMDWAEVINGWPFGFPAPQRFPLDAYPLVAEAPPS